MNTLLKNKHAIFGKLGDFWYRQQTEDAPNGPALARTLSHLLDGNHAIDKMSAAIQKFSGQMNTYRNNYTYTFNPSDVRILNFNPQQRYITGSYPTLTITKPIQYALPYTGALQIEQLPVDSPSPADETLSTSMENTLGDNDYGVFWFELEDANRTVLFSDDEARPLYFVPLPLNFEPIVITTQTRELTASFSFKIGPGYILFYEDPITLFPDSQIFFRSLIIRDTHPLDYTYQVDNIYTDGRYISKYMRQTHSAAALRLALAEVAGLPILHADSVLQQKFVNFDDVVYEFDTQVIKVPLYIEHTQLTVGDSYTAGTIIGEEYIKVFSASNTSDDPWYRTADLEEVWAADGLSLNAITPFSGVVVPDAVGTFSYNGATGGGTAHYYLDAVTGSNTAAYWQLVRNSETYTDKYLADVAGVTLGATANCLDFYFSNMLAYNSVVIQLRTQELGTEKHQNVLSFIRRNLPINVTPIILT